MVAAIGMIMVVVCVIGSYVAMGGALYILNQPLELVIIFGSGVSAFLIANKFIVVKIAMKRLFGVFKGSKYNRDDYIENIMVQYQFYRLIKQRGTLVLEQHIEKPLESPIFSSFPRFCKHEHGLHLFCDYLRVIALGMDNPHKLESMMEQDIELLEKEDESACHALAILADSFPALGIVAAVLGVIKTMSKISEPPEVLGNLIAAALVGTFLGVLLCYGWFQPLANAAKEIFEEEKTYLSSIRIGMVSYLEGLPPTVCVEFARKGLSEHMRPTFEELENQIAELPNPTTT